MPITVVNKYTTTDGTEFATLQEAELHEKKQRFIHRFKDICPIGTPSETVAITLSETPASLKELVSAIDEFFGKTELKKRGRLNKSQIQQIKKEIVGYVTVCQIAKGTDIIKHICKQYADKNVQVNSKIVARILRELWEVDCLLLYSGETVKREYRLV